MSTKKDCCRACSRWDTGRRRRDRRRAMRAMPVTGQRLPSSRRNQPRQRSQRRPPPAICRPRPRRAAATGSGH